MKRSYSKDLRTFPDTPCCPVDVVLNARGATFNAARLKGRVCRLDFRMWGQSPLRFPCQVAGDRPSNPYRLCCACDMYVYIYIYGNPPHELPTLVLYRKYRVKTAFSAGPDSVSLKTYRKQTQISRERVSQLIHVRREVRILYLSRTTEINLTFQQDMSVNSLRLDVSTKSTAALYPPNPKPTLPRENQKNQKKHLLRHYAAKLQKDCFFGFP